MNANNPSPTGSAWALIEIERKRDRLIKRICIGAWSAVLVVVLTFAVVVGASVLQMIGGALSDQVPWMTVVGAALPLMSMLMWLFLLVAVLSTVAVFLRMRASSLNEIQLRLAALEELVTRGSP